MAYKRGARFKNQFQDRSGKGRGRSPNRNDDNSSSPGQLSPFTSHGTAINRTPSPQGERNKERGISQEEIDKRYARAERFGIQLDPSQRRNAGGKLNLGYKKPEVEEPPPDPIVDFLKVVEEYVKTQTLIKKVKEIRQTNGGRKVAWDFFHEEVCPITLESLYQNDKSSQRADPSDEEEEYVGEGSMQKKDRPKGVEIPSTPRFLDVEMEDVQQFLTSPLPPSPAFRIFESMDVDETFPSSPSLTPQVHPSVVSYTPPLINQFQPDRNRKSSIFHRLGRKESITSTPPGTNDNKMFDDKGNVNYAVIQKDLHASSSMDVEYGSVLENDESELSEPKESIDTNQETETFKVNSIGIEEDEQDEQDEVAESQASDEEEKLPSPTIPTPKLDLYNLVFGPPPLTRAQSGYQEKIRKRKNKFKKPRFPDRRKNEMDRKKREYQARISENRNIKEVLDDIDRKEALCVRELNSGEKTHDSINVLNYNKTNKLQDDYVIVREELSRRSQIIDRHNKESLDRAKKDSKYKHSFSKVIKNAEREIYNTPSLIPGS